MYEYIKVYIKTDFWKKKQHLYVLNIPIKPSLKRKILIYYKYIFNSNKLRSSCVISSIINAYSFNTNN